MGKAYEAKYVNRPQKDYSMSFIQNFDQDVERRDLGVKAAARKYCIQFHSTVSIWFRKEVTLIGRIKHHLICLRHENNKSWNLSKRLDY